MAEGRKKLEERYIQICYLGKRLQLKLKSNKNIYVSSCNIP